MRTENKSLFTYSRELGSLTSISSDRSIRNYEGYGKRTSVVKTPDSSVHLRVRRYSEHDFGVQGDLNQVHVVRNGHAHHEPLLSFNRGTGPNFSYEALTPDGDKWVFSHETPEEMIIFLASLFNPGQLENRPDIEIPFIPGPNYKQNRPSNFYDYMSRHTGVPVLDALTGNNEAIA